MTKPWFTANAKTASIAIHSDIGQGGVDALEFNKTLNTMRGAKTLHISINSNGGEVAAGFAIYNMLARFPARKVVTIEGLAASMASVVAMAGDEIVMPSNALMMIYNPWGSVQGGADQIASFSEAMKRMQANIVDAYRKRTKLPEDEIQTMMDKETWLDANEAVKLGFADKIEFEMKLAAQDVSKFKNTPRVYADSLRPKVVSLDDIRERAWQKWNSAGKDPQK